MNIVYIQLGNSKYKFVKTAIERSLSIFPDLNHHLISDNPYYSRNIASEVKAYNPAKDLDLEFRSKRSTDSAFRDNYWNLTLNRLLALTEFQIEKNLSGVMHVESDVILMPNFPFATFRLEKKISWCEYGDSLDVASILFIPTPDQARWLKEQILAELQKDPSATDMVILNRIRTKNPDTVRVLQGSPSQHEAHCERINPSQRSNALTGVFDGITLGMWLTGQDPKNNLGRYQIRDNSPFLTGATHINPSIIQFAYTNESNLILKQDCCGAISQLWSLHVHSKNTRLLSLKWKQEILRLCADSKARNRFSISALIWMFTNAYQSKNLLKFLAGLPYSKSIVRFFNSLAGSK